MIKENNKKQSISLSLSDLKNADGAIPMAWSEIKNLNFCSGATLRGKDKKISKLGNTWDGPMPTFSELKWGVPE